MAVTIQEVQAYTSRALGRILNAGDTSQQKAVLANLRRGVGHIPGEIPQLWGEFLIDMPESLYGKGKPSKAEWAIYTALTLFALHQQGHDLKKEPMHCKEQRLGTAIAHLVTNEDDMKRIVRRFNAAATANSVTALAYYLRGLVQLLRANGIPLDYVSLSGDLFRFQFSESVNAVRLTWGQDYYGYFNQNRKKEADES